MEINFNLNRRNRIPFVCDKFSFSTAPNAHIILLSFCVKSSLNLLISPGSFRKTNDYISRDMAFLAINCGLQWSAIENLRDWNLYWSNAETVKPAQNMALSLRIVSTSLPTSWIRCCWPVMKAPENAYEYKLVPDFFYFLQKRLSNIIAFRQILLWPFFLIH